MVNSNALGLFIYFLLVSLFFTAFLGTVDVSHCVAYFKKSSAIYDFFFSIYIRGGDILFFPFLFLFHSWIFIFLPVSGGWSLLILFFLSLICLVGGGRPFSSFFHSC